MNPFSCQAVIWKQHKYPFTVWHFDQQQGWEMSHIHYLYHHVCDLFTPLVHLFQVWCHPGVSEWCLLRWHPGSWSHGHLQLPAPPRPCQGPREVEPFISVTSMSTNLRVHFCGQSLVKSHFKWRGTWWAGMGISVGTSHALKWLPSSLKGVGLWRSSTQRPHFYALL